MVHRMAPTEPAQPAPSKYAETGLAPSSIVALDAFDALGHLSIRELRSMLEYLSGYAPSAVLHAVAFIEHRRRDAELALIARAARPVLPAPEVVRDMSAADAAELTQRMNQDTDAE